MLRQVGKTQDGRPVVAGVFRAFETWGLPLDVLLGSIREAGFIPCWVSFYREAKLAGMSHSRILAKLDEAVMDSYGAPFRDHVICNL